jgi:hypothetical protein
VQPPPLDPVDPPEAPRPSRSAYDPYAPLRARDPHEAGAPGHAPGRSLVAVYGAAVALDLIGRVAMHFRVASVLRYAAFAVGLSGGVKFVVAMGWIYSAWQGIPATHRGTISPRRAVLSLFIPFYNVYWALAMNAALCDTLDRILERGKTGRRAPRMLGTAACVVWLGMSVLAFALRLRGLTPPVADVFFPAISGSFWFAYMIACDRAREAVAQLGDNATAIGKPRLVPLQEKRGPRALALVAFFVLVVLGLALWQVLSPGEPRAPSTEGHS